MKKFSRGLMICSLVGAVSFAACTKRQGPLERAGERTDEIMDNVSEGENPLKRKGALERAGESIDETLGNDRR